MFTFFIASHVNSRASVHIMTTANMTPDELDALWAELSERERAELKAEHNDQGEAEQAEYVRFGGER